MKARVAHPDKFETMKQQNANLTYEECEKSFKEIQAAYDLI